MEKIGHILYAMLRKLFILTLNLFFLLSFTSIGLAKKNFTSITVVDTSSFPPFSFLDDQNRPQGISIDLWKLWSKKNKIKVNFKLINWEEALELVKKREDCIISDIYYTEDRSKYFDFSNPYLKIDINIFFHKDIYGIKDIYSLSGFNIGIIKNYSIEEYLRKNFPSYTLVTFPDEKRLFQSLFNNELKVFILEKPTAIFFLSQKKEGQNFKFVSKPVFTQDLRAAVKKGNKVLLDLVNSGFSKITDKEKQEILKKWQGESFFNKEIVYKLIVIFAGSIFLFLLWNISLRVKVNNKTKELSKLTSQFKAILLSLGDALIVTDKEGKIILMNAIAEKLTGWKLQQAMDKNISDVFVIVNNFTRKKVDNPVEKVLKTGKIVELANHTKLISREGQEYHIADSAAPVIDEKNDLLGTVLIFRDVTEEYNLRNKIYYQKILLEKAFSLAKACVLEIDLKNNYIKADDNAYQLIELDKNKQISVDLLFKLIKQEDKDKVKENIQKISSKNFIKLKFRIKTLETKKIRIIFALGEYDKTNDKIILVAQDITEFWELKEKISQSEEKYKTIFEETPIGIIVYDKNTVIQECNDSLAKVIGINKEKLIGFNLQEQLDNIKLKEAILLSLQKGFSSYEGNYMSKLNKKEVFIKCIFKALKKEDNIIGGIGLVEDITEIEKHRQELFKIEKLTSVGLLAGGIAHDFNNLLTAIFGQIRIAREKLDSLNPAFHNLENALVTIERAKKISAQLLSLTKSWEPIKSIFNLKDSILELVELHLSGSKIKPVYNFSSDYFYLEGDKTQIEQAISNIIINAKQAMNEKGILEINLKHIEVKDKEKNILTQGKYIVVEIKDIGPGIPADHLDKIFDPYFTTKETGSGLGLSITYSIIKKHKGEIRVESKLDKGTTFFIYLPAYLKEVKLEQEKQEQIIPSKRAKILFIDDEIMLLTTFKELLEMYGYEVEIASTGEEGLIKYKRALAVGNPFDIVITDLTIPGAMGGKEIIPKILEINPEAVCIISSGYSQDPVIANYKEYGFKAALQKPFEIEELLKLLNRLL